MHGKKLAAALIVCLCFGSLHAYGVLLAPIEQWLGTNRTVTSLGYALAVAALTAGVYLNGRLEAVLGPQLRLIGCGIVAALGLIVAGGSSTTAGLLAGFGLLYGLANGVAYAMSLSLAASAMPGREAQAIGLATAAYGFGAVLCAQIFDAVLGRLHVATVLMMLAPVVFVVCLLGAAFISDGKVAALPSVMGIRNRGARPLVLLWAAYLLGAFSGLMVLAHAPAIAFWRGGSDIHGGIVSGLVSLGSVAGGYLGGVIAGQMQGRRSLFIPVVLQAAVLGSIPFVMGHVTLPALLATAGLCYGILIAAVPVEVRRISGPRDFSRSYGKVFTAWGLAGVAGPVAAGYLFDMTHGYGAALAMAAVLSLCSCLFILGVPR